MLTVPELLEIKGTAGYVYVRLQVCYYKYSIVDPVTDEVLHYCLHHHAFI